jgi:hypothetical protein
VFLLFAEEIAVETALEEVEAASTGRITDEKITAIMRVKIDLFMS